VVITGLRSLYGWHEDWLRITDTASQLECEDVFYKARVRPYDGKNPYKVLAERLRKIKMAETQSWISAHRKAQGIHLDKVSRESDKCPLLPIRA
jgi:hypothetical protein